jgi:hypothetical protein
LASAPSVSGHPQSDFYAHRWARRSTAIDVFFTASEWGTQAKDEARHGFNVWDFAGGADLKFDFQDGTHSNYPGQDALDCSGPRPTNEVHFDGSLGGGAAIAKANTCVTDGVWDAFVVVFDQGENWDFSGNPGSNEFDFRSTATHEAGHATGFGTGSGVDVHFTGSSLCPDNNTDETMCPSLDPGTTYLRSLEAHDKHTLDNAY